MDTRTPVDPAASPQVHDDAGESYRSTPCFDPTGALKMPIASSLPKLEGSLERLVSSSLSFWPRWVR